MKKSFTFKLLALFILAAMVFAGCAPAPGYEDSMSYTKPEIISSISVNDAAAQEDARYAENENFELFVNEKNATFYVVDKNGTRWDSVPQVDQAAYADKPAALSTLLSLVRLHHVDVLNNKPDLPTDSYSSCVVTGKTVVERIQGGVRFVFNFEDKGFVIPIQVMLHKNGVEISLINQEIQETGDKLRLVGVDIAPYFNAPNMADDGYIVVPDGSGALIDWKNVKDPSISYNQTVYGQDGAIIVSERKYTTEDIRIPVFGNQYKAAGEEAGNHLGYTAIITQGAARASINASIGSNDVPYSPVYTTFVYREYAENVTIESKNKSANLTEESHTVIPVQTVRYVLQKGETLDYVKMAGAYRAYLIEDLGITPQTQAGSAPMVVELFGGVMKQQFVMGFPVDKVLPLTSFEDAQQIVKDLKAAGVDELIINYTEWQKDGTDAAIQTEIKPEGNLGGKKQLENFIALCKQENVSVYLNVNTNRMAQNALGYNTKYDSAESLRHDPAVQYYHKYDTGLPDKSSSTYLLTPTKLLQVAQGLASSAGKYDVTGLASTVLGEMIYSDFSKHATPRDHAEYFWKDSLKALADAKGQLLLAGGNAYAFEYATFITDMPMDYSKNLIESQAIPFYQIAMHGIIPMSTTAINDMANTRQGLLYAIETGSSIKWDWTARNQDDLVETHYNAMIGSSYESWIDEAVEMYKEASPLLKKIANCSVVSHENLADDLVRVVWSDGTEVLVNYSREAAVWNDVQIEAESFVWKEAAA